MTMATSIPTNTERSSWALKALEAFASETGQTFTEPLDQAIAEEVVGDLICNLLHACDDAGVDCVPVLRYGLSHHAYEAIAEQNPDADGEVDPIDSPEAIEASDSVRHAFDEFLADALARLGLRRDDCGDPKPTAEDVMEALRSMPFKSQIDLDFLTAVRRGAKAEALARFAKKGTS